MAAMAHRAITAFSLTFTASRLTLGRRSPRPACRSSSSLTLLPLFHARPHSSRRTRNASRDHPGGEIAGRVKIKIIRRIRRIGPFDLTRAQRTLGAKLNTG